ncbi:hypothetical protein [Lysinibacter cavernae]|uniref:Uncharacterized protein n=1 Tax=Lysinibacter cavernae TaxID=1640652 RepID=A0A7X5R1R7_9MICO|nr:hypothetical protein [Lysinibacter cavernae]NIH53981.1 hypothetical protein [Lysinibacter cavernae]
MAQIHADLPAMATLEATLMLATDSLPQPSGNASDCHSLKVVSAVSDTLNVLESLWQAVDHTLTILGQKTKDTIDLYAAIDNDASSRLNGALI